jgi:hypothetical protein
MHLLSDSQMQITVVEKGAVKVDAICAVSL